MAKLAPSSSSSGGSNLNWGVTDQPSEPGTYVGVVLDCLEATVKNQFAKTEDDPKERNVCRWLIAYLNDDDEVCLAQSKEMSQSSNTESHLFAFLKGLLGEDPVFDSEYDYLEEVGRPCMVYIGQGKSKKGTIYPVVNGVSVISKRLAGDAPDPEEIEVPGGRRNEIQYEAPKAPAKAKAKAKPKTKAKAEVEEEDLDDNPFG